VAEAGDLVCEGPTKIDQFKTLTGLRDLRPELAPFGITVCRALSHASMRPFRGSSDG
jgi:hypothetical protein